MGDFDPTAVSNSATDGKSCSVPKRWSYQVGTPRTASIGQFQIKPICTLLYFFAPTLIHHSEGVLFSFKKCEFFTKKVKHGIQMYSCHWIQINWTQKSFPKHLFLGTESQLWSHGFVWKYFFRKKEMSQEHNLKGPTAVPSCVGETSWSVNTLLSRNQTNAFWLQLRSVKVEHILG